MNRWLALVVLALSAHLVIGGDTEEKEPKKANKKQADLKWARGVVDDFWAAGKDGDTVQAAVLLSAELKKAIGQLGQGGDNSYRFTQLQNHGMQSWSVVKEEMAPDQEEAVFQGVLRGKSGEAAFSVRVIREKEGGRWRIHFFRIEDWKKKEPKTEK